MNLSKRKLDASLKECSFDPRKPGNLSGIVTDVSPRYLVKRSFEFLRALDALEEFDVRMLRDAIGLLAYAKELYAEQQLNYTSAGDHGE